MWIFRVTGSFIKYYAIRYLEAYFLYNKKYDSREVYDFLVKFDLELRIVQEDGVSYAVTCDLKINRLDIILNNNIITSVLW